MLILKEKCDNFCLGHLFEFASRASDQRSLMIPRE